MFVFIVVSFCSWCWEKR